MLSKLTNIVYDLNIDILPVDSSESLKITGIVWKKGGVFPI